MSDVVLQTQLQQPGVIADFGHDGGVVGFEVLEASKVVEQTGEMQFAIAG